MHGKQHLAATSRNRPFPRASQPAKLVLAKC
jgi:hypothetical protein